jgi:hypothetical protein
MMSTVDQPDECVVRVDAPDEARKAPGRCLPERLVVEDITTDGERTAFQEALAEA